MVSSEILALLKQKLEQEKRELEDMLKKFAKPDPKLPGDWDSEFPQFEQRSAHPQEDSQEVEEYERRLDIEYNLELRLKEVNEALERIKNDNFGICTKCSKEIPTERLIANPAASTCIECARK
jgi:DnaK suppressor protein